MPPRKRAAANDGEGATTRAKKASKTENGQSAPKGRRGRSKPTAEEHDAAFKEFKAKALPIHVAFTHTPPSIDKEADAGGKKKKDEGYIGNLTIVPSAFSTGSFGWKGTKRVKVELQGAEGAEKETVTLQIQINAVVHGSKAGAKDDEEYEKEKDKDDEDKVDGDDDED